MVIIPLSLYTAFLLLEIYSLFHLAALNMHCLMNVIEYFLQEANACSQWIPSVFIDAIVNLIYRSARE